MDLIFPYNDEVLEYDLTLHKYVLTPSAVLWNIGTNLSTALNASGDANPSTMAERILKKVTNTVYNFIYQNTMGESWCEFLLARYEPLRKVIEEMLLAQMEYVLINGFINNYSGVNVGKGTAMKLEELRGRAKIADDVEQLCSQKIPGLGYSLSYTGSLPRLSRELYREGY